MQERSPAAPHVEHPGALLNMQLFGHKPVLGMLCLFETHGKIAIVPGAAEIRHFPYAEPEYFIHRGIREIYIFFSGQVVGLLVNDRSESIIRN